MSLQLVARCDYSGAEGLQQIRELQVAMEIAVAADDWQQIRHLDRACSLAMERVIQASTGDLTALKTTLQELKGTYLQLIMKCKCEEQAIAI